MGVIDNVNRRSAGVITLNAAVYIVAKGANVVDIYMERLFS
jgi:hypothetical protein